MEGQGWIYKYISRAHDVFMLPRTVPPLAYASFDLEGAFGAPKDVVHGVPNSHAALRVLYVRDRDVGAEIVVAAIIIFKFIRIRIRLVATPRSWVCERERRRSRSSLFSSPSKLFCERCDNPVFHFEQFCLLLQFDVGATESLFERHNASTRLEVGRFVADKDGSPQQVALGLVARCISCSACRRDTRPVSVYAGCGRQRAKGTVISFSFGRRTYRYQRGVEICFIFC